MHIKNVIVYLLCVAQYTCCSLSKPTFELMQDAMATDLLSGPIAPISFSFLSFDPYDNEYVLRTYPFTQINQGGFYRLADNITAQITINSSNVTLDLAGHTISNGTHGISIASGLSNIIIQNGSISSATSNGINIGTGCTQINLKDLRISGCTLGIYLDTVKNCFIDSCELCFNTTGSEIVNAESIILKKCIAISNEQAAYSFLSTFSCAAFDCQAISTGSINMNASGDTSFVYGFYLNQCEATLLQNCLAQSTQNLAATDIDTRVAGFAILGTSTQCNSIINCESGYSTVNEFGYAIPYGVYLQPQLLIEEKDTFTSGTTVDSLSWSPDGNYLAAAIFTASPGQLAVFKYQRDSQTLILLTSIDINADIYHTSWSPSGQFLAIGSTASPQARVYEFDRLSNSLTLRDSAVLGTIIGSSWSLDEQYVGFSGTADAYIYKWNKVTKAFETQITISSTPEVETIAFSPTDENMFALGNDDSQVLLYRLNRSDSTTTLLDTLSLGGTTDFDKVSWSPDGKYLSACRDSSTGDDFHIIQVANDTLTLITGDDIGTVQASSWAPDSAHITVGYNTALNTYYFNRQAGSLTLLDTQNIGSTIREVEWSPDGEAIATCGTNFTTVYSAFSFPKANQLINNIIYGATSNENQPGYGIFGSSISNLIIKNTSYNNPVNYACVTNIFNPLFGIGPSITQNISTIINNPIPQLVNLPLKIKRTELMLESLIDNLL